MNHRPTAPDDVPSAQWLDALAGQPDPQADSQLNLQALALRKALQQRSQRLQQTVPPADPALYHQLLFRLRREGLLSPAPRWQRLPVWGLAATVVLVVGLGLQLGGWFGSTDSADTLRGGGPITQMQVSQPEARLAELLTGLQAAGARPEVRRLDGGRLQLRVTASEAVLDYLASQRIEPTLANGSLTLLLVPLTSPP